ncbi:hypothetical protein CRUP_014331, partial [Coryphaenoides rupestris]
HEAKVRVFGKLHDIPRKQAVYGEPGLHYTYSGVKHGARQWTPTLEYIRDSVTKVTGQAFNFVLVNRYKDGEDHMGEHRDDERELDPLCPIALRLPGSRPGLCLPAQGRRAWAVAAAAAEDRAPWHRGASFLMNPTHQHVLVPQLPRRRAVLQPRINLTFRRILTSGGEGAF